MTTKTDEVVGEGTPTDTDLPVGQAQDDVEQEDDAAFSAGFERVTGKTEAQPNTDKPATEKTAAELEAEAQAQREAEERARAEQEAADREREWEGVPPIVRQQLEKLQGLPGTIDKLAGHVGNFKRQLDATIATATAAAKGAGTAAPTDAQVAAAKADKTGEKWNQMRDDFPEWVEAVEERLAAMGATAAGPGVDVDSLRREVSDVVAQGVQTGRQLALLDVKHAGWESTINTPEFKSFALQGGPNVDRYSEFKALKRADPAKAGEMLESFKSSYPEWWKSKGSALFSGSAKDAIALLDGYVEHQTTVKAEQTKRLSRENRLARSVAVQGAAQPPRAGISDEEAFGRGFKRARGG